MPFPSGSQGMIPWMNGRIDAGPGGSLPNSTIISFGATADIVFKWIEDGTTSASEAYYINAHGSWGSGQIDHRPIVCFVQTLPTTTLPSVATRALLPTVYVPGDTVIVTSDNSYWIATGTTGWIRMMAKVNAGTVSAYSITATVFTVTVPQADLPKINNISIQPGGYYDLCWNQNAKHAPQFDAVFNILPVGHLIWDKYFDRTELNSRIAGEKGLFEDECITAGQVEAGKNALIRWRNLDGSLPGYTTDAAKAGNLVIEGAFSTQGALYNGGVYYDETTLIVQFRNSPSLETNLYGPKIPVEFNVVEEADASVVTASIRSADIPTKTWVKHWWVAGDAANQPIFTTQTAQVVGGFNVLAGAISFSGHGFWDINDPLIPVFVGTGEVVVEHANTVVAATTTPAPPIPAAPQLVLPPNNTLSPQNRYMFEGVVPERDGLYLVHTVIQGLSTVHPEFVTGTGVFDHEHEMALHYFVKRGGVYYRTYCLDHKNKFFKGLLWGEEPPVNPIWPGTFSNKWSLQGTAILDLKQGDQLFAQAAAICYVPSPAVGGFKRNYTVNYITQHIELLTNYAPSTSLYPHSNTWNPINFFDFT